MGLEETILIAFSLALSRNKPKLTFLLEEVWSGGVGWGRGTEDGMFGVWVRAGVVRIKCLC